MTVAQRKMDRRESPPPNADYLHLIFNQHLTEYRDPFETEIGRAFGKDEGASLLEILESLHELSKDSKMKGLLVEFRHFSGNWAMADAIRSEILKVKAAHKEVVTYATSYDAKAYFIATAANKIYLMPNGQVDLKGLSMTTPYFRKALDRLGIEPILVRAGKFKAAAEPLIKSEMSEEARLQNSTLLNDIWNQFRNLVLQAKPELKDSFDKHITDMDYVTDLDAYNFRLVDELKYKDEVQAHLGGIGVPLEKYSEKAKEKFEHPSHRQNVALIYATGTIVADGEREGTIGASEFIKALEQADRDKSIDAIVLRIDSPGGDAIASEEIYHSLRKLKKKVVVSMGGVAASGGYYIASASDHIMASPFTITGSIGVFSFWPNFKNLFNDKLSTKFETVKTHPSADFMSGTRGITANEEKKVQAEIMAIYKRFLDVVAEGRKSSVKNIDEIAQGRVWSGVSAKQVHLVDSFGDLFDALDKAASLAGIKGPYGVKIIESSQNPWAALVSLAKTLSTLKLSSLTDLYTLLESEEVKTNRMYMLEPRIFLIQ